MSGPEFGLEVRNETRSGNERGFKMDALAVSCCQTSKENWTWVKGAFHTVDRPYGPVLDYIHHRIGSTHVAHHVCASIPFYKAGCMTLHYLIRLVITSSRSPIK